MHARTHRHVLCIIKFLGGASPCRDILYDLRDAMSSRLSSCPEVRGCPYLGGRSVLNDRFWVDSLSVLGSLRFSAPQSVPCPPPWILYGIIPYV